MIFYERRFGRLELTHCDSYQVSHLTPFSPLCALIFQSFGAINTPAALSMAVCSTLFLHSFFFVLICFIFGSLLFIILEIIT